MLPSRRPAEDAETLLATLLVTPVSASVPGAIRAGVSRRSRFDRFLLWGTRGCIAAALALVALWVMNGPLYDLLFAPSRQEQRRPAPSRSLAVQTDAAGPGAAAASASFVGDTPIPGAAEGITHSTAPTPPRPPSPDAALMPGTTGLGAAVVRQHISPRVATPDLAEPSWLTAPAAQIDTSVVPRLAIDNVWQTTDYAAGYFVGTGLPGFPSNVAIGGHAGLRGGVFANLWRLKAGDDIYVDAGNWRFSYRVRESKVVWPEQVEVLESRGVAELTLLTCTNWDLQRLVVVADLVGSAPLFTP